MKEKKKVLDLGTGAGFPGMVLAILCPDYEFVLADSLNKRIEFLKVVINRLQIHNVSVIHGRAEELGRNENFRNQFDYVVSRAVAELPVLLEYCIPFVKRNGYFVSYKSGSSDEEIQQAEKAVNILGGKIEKTDKFLLPETDMGRALVNIKKIKITPAKYPRKAGMPSREPL